MGDVLAAGESIAYACRRAHTNHMRPAACIVTVYCLNMNIKYYIYNGLVAYVQILIGNAEHPR